MSHITCRQNLLKLPDKGVVGLGQSTCSHGVSVHAGLLDFVEQHQLVVELAFSKSLSAVQACPLLPASCQMHTTVQKLSRLEGLEALFKAQSSPFNCQVLHESHLGAL